LREREFRSRPLARRNFRVKPGTRAASSVSSGLSVPVEYDGMGLGALTTAGVLEAFGKRLP
jgi:hypothetical protein